MDASKRRFCTRAPLALAALLAGAGGVAQARAKADARPRVIKVEARKFVYTPNVIMLKLGQPVVLELMALDFTHGFSIPDLKIRADLVPGKVIRVALAADVAGEFAFLCDNFCGSGHEEMNGTIIVKP